MQKHEMGTQTSKLRKLVKGNHVSVDAVLVNDNSANHTATRPIA